MDIGRFVLKVVLVSAAISIAIKYGGPWLPLSPTTSVALAMVLLPSFLLGGLLLLRQEGDRP